MCAQMKTQCAQYKTTSHQEKNGAKHWGGGKEERKHNVPEHRKIN